MPSVDIPPGVLGDFCRLSLRGDDGDWLDGQTWSDLDMDAVSARLDRTASAPGRMLLDRILRTPTLNTETLAERDALIDALAPEREASAIVRRATERLRTTAGAEDLMRLLWDDPPARLPLGSLLPILAILAAASIPLALFMGKAAVFVPIVAFAVNAGVHFRTRIHWQTEIQALRYVGVLRACGRAIAIAPHPALLAYQRRLSQALSHSRGIARRLTLLSAGGLKDLLYEYVNVLFLLELRAYECAARTWPANAPALREVFLIVGELDAFASVAIWRTELCAWSRPQLAVGDPRVEIEDGIHPLLAGDSAVANSITLLGRGCLITGANMSGKSTLLRMVGINAVLAQTIFTCTARRYRATPLTVVSSMRVSDAILDGKSRYLAEAERLLVLVRRAGTGQATLCLIDELLSGTNAAERLTASRAILDYLVARGLLVLAATHDLELTELLAPRYDGYFLADDFVRDDLRFDHRLRRGVATTRNAVDLLERLGYPEEILSQAREIR